MRKKQIKAAGIKERGIDLNNLYDLLESELPLFIDGNLLHRLRTCKERHSTNRGRNGVRFEDENYDPDAVRLYVEYMEPLLPGRDYDDRKRVALHFLYRGRS